MLERRLIFFRTPTIIYTASLEQLFISILYSRLDFNSVPWCEQSWLSSGHRSKGRVFCREINTLQLCATHLWLQSMKHAWSAGYSIQADWKTENVSARSKHWAQTRLPPHLELQLIYDACKLKSEGATTIRQGWTKKREDEERVDVRRTTRWQRFPKKTEEKERQQKKKSGKKKKTRL